SRSPDAAHDWQAVSYRLGLVLTLVDIEYERALDFLFQRTTGAVRLGLEHTSAFLAHLGDPQRSLRRVVHLAGTNGKGSTAATLEALLRRGGLRVGKYTSPHLVDFRERIVVDGQPIPASRVTSFIHRELQAIEA